MRFQQRTKRWFLGRALLFSALIAACSCSGKPGRTQQQITRGPASTFSEPQSYSATVIQTIEDENTSEAVETRVVRSGDLLREEWREAGELRAAIWRPDLGKAFLLSIDRRLYVETGIDSGSANGGSAADATGDSQRTFSAPVEPETVEERPLADLLIDGHPCASIERREVFSDGHAEVTRTYRAMDLDGLPLRIESETARSGSPLRIHIERKNVDMNVSAAEFNVPSDFKKATSL